MNTIEEFTVYDSIEMLKEMISRPSFSKEESDVADYIENLWRRRGHAVNRKGNNLWIVADNYDESKPTVLLNSHIDTVKPVEGWTVNPFAAEEGDDGRITGLGSNDAGASVVSLYAAYSRLISKEQPYNFILLVSAEEEISGRNGLESVLPELPTISFAVVGEPTEMQPAVAEKGLMVLDCIASGKAGHAARDEGVNAIYKAITDIEWFRNYRFPKESQWLGAVKMSVTMIEAGAQHNVIPDRCRFTVDVRVNDRYTNEELLALIRANVSCDVQPRSLRLNSSHTPDNHPFIARTSMLGLQPFGSPTLSDQALMNFPSVKIGPGSSARSHSADEHIYVAEIREAIELYCRLLDNL
jgi:acetylornithine deacetylase